MLEQKSARQADKSISNRLWMAVPTDPAHYRAYGLIVISVVLLLVAVWGYSGTNRRLLGPPLGEVIGQDFRAYFLAASAIEANENLYETALQFGRNPDFVEYLSEDATGYLYPPLVAILMRLLIPLGYDASLFLWTGIKIILLTTSALLTVQIFGETASTPKRIRLIFALLLFFTFYASQQDFKTGNMDILILFLMTLAYFFYSHSLYVAAGLVLAITITFKPTLAPILLFFAWRRCWQLCIVAAVGATLLMILSFSIVGWERLADYVQVTGLYAASADVTVFPVNQSLRAFLSRAFTENNYIEPLAVIPWIVDLLPALIGILAVGAWIMVMVITPEQKPLARGLQYGYTLTTLMLATPYVGENHFVWLLMPIAAMVLISIETLPDRMGFALLVVSSLLMLYLGYPDLHDAIYFGSERLIYERALVEREKVLFTGAYLYGLFALNFFLACFLYVLKTNIGDHQHQELQGSGPH